MKVSWTPTAIRTYFNILAYLEEAWTNSEIENFIYEVERLLVQIAINPVMFKASIKKKNIRKGFITKNNTLYYRIKPRKKEIELLIFWDNRQDTEKLVY